MSGFSGYMPVSVNSIVFTVPSGQWSGSGSDYYFTVQAPNVTTDSMLDVCYDSSSKNYFTGTSLWIVAANGSFTVHVDSVPAGDVTIKVRLEGVIGEAQYQVLSDVYSKSQTYSKSEVYTKTETNSAISQSTANIGTHVTTNMQTASVDAGAFTTVASVNLSAGVYIVTGRIAFGADATGRNVAFLTTNSNSTSNLVNDSTACNGRSTLEITIRVGLSAAGTVYLKAHKATGTGNVDAFIDAIRLA